MLKDFPFSLKVAESDSNARPARCFLKSNRGRLDKF
jgi:hypothetical protein